MTGPVIVHNGRDQTIRFDGDPAAFWEFVQAGCGSFNDDCDPAPFADLGS